MITAAEGYPELETAVMNARRSVWFAFRIFDPDTRLHAHQVGDGTWQDLLRHKLDQGVSVRVLISDFDPIVAGELHEQTWRSVAKLKALQADGDIATLAVRHPARVGKGVRIGLWVLAAREIEKQRKLFNKAGPNKGADMFAFRPGLWRYLRQDAQGRFRWRSLLLPRLFPATLHHKIAVIDTETAIIGGLDVDDRRFDDPDHNRPAEQTWHDVSVRAESPVAADIAEHIARTWNDNRLRMAALAREQSRRAPDGRGIDATPAAPLDLPATRSTESEGDGIRLLRTVSHHRRRMGLQLSPRTLVHEIEDAHVELFSNARRRLYIETQFLRSERIADALAAAGRANPSLDLILIVPAAPEGVAFENTRHFMHKFGEQLQVDCLDLVREAFGRRAVVLSPVRTRRRRYDGRDTLSGAEIIYVHSKVAIADDTDAIVGSANLNGRSMRWDTEAAVRITGTQAVRDLRDKLLAAWIVRDAPQQDLSAADAATWHRLIDDNTSKSPEDRTLRLVAYDAEAARDFGQANPLLPEELV